MQPLRPTLYRSCRVLANPLRLQLLRQLFNSSEESVAVLASRLGISEPLASIHLRALNARGLISARPEMRFVFYSALANPLVEHAGTILHCLRDCARAGLENEDIIHTATAFTHPRRVEIVAALSQREMAPAELMLATRISTPALNRHLRKLLDREMIEQNKMRYRLRKPTNPLGCTLQKIALA